MTPPFAINDSAQAEIAVSAEWRACHSARRISAKENRSSATRLDM